MSIKEIENRICTYIDDRKKSFLIGYAVFLVVTIFIIFKVKLVYWLSKALGWVVIASIVFAKGVMFGIQEKRRKENSILK